MYSFKDKLPEFLWKSAYDFEMPWNITQTHNGSKDTQYVLSSQVYNGYEVISEYETDGGVRRPNSHKQWIDKYEYWPIMRLSRLNNNKDPDSVGGLNLAVNNDVKFQFIPVKNKVRIRRSYGFDVFKNRMKEDSPEFLKNYHLDDYTWCLQALRENDQLYKCEIKKEDVNNQD